MQFFTSTALPILTPFPIHVLGRIQQFGPISQRSPIIAGPIIYAPFLTIEPRPIFTLPSIVAKGSTIHSFSHLRFWKRSLFANNRSQGLPTSIHSSLTLRYPTLSPWSINNCCLLYTSDAADEEDSVDLGGRRIIKKK